jgi:protein associated with RNAse G/E
VFEKKSLLYFLQKEYFSVQGTVDKDGNAEVVKVELSLAPVSDDLNVS